MSAQGMLEVTRERRYTGFAQPYKVMVDGLEVGTIKNGITQSYPVTPGTHEVLVKIEISESPPLAVDVPPGGTVRLRCLPRANPFTALFYTLFWAKKSLRLEVA